MDFAEHVKSSVDIVRVVGEYVRLKRQGSGQRYAGLCPFHTEKTPSFSVHSGHQFFKCFGCNAGGDVFTFVMQIESVSFFEALKIVAERNGIPVPRREYSDPQAKLRAGLLEMYEFAAQHFQANLRSAAGAPARAYLERRGVPMDVAEHFGIGVAADSWDVLAKALAREGFASEQIETSGLVRKRNEGNGVYDYFRGRLVFPIHDESGKPIAFGGRALKAEDEPKYLNSPETALYRKQHVLYNLHRAKSPIRKQDVAVLVEGYMDAIAVYAAGVQHVVAICGTALTETQARALKRHASRVVVNLDPDAAGAKAAERSIETLLTESMHVRVLRLEENLDPDEYIQRFGAEQYARKVETSPLYYYWLADQARSRFDMHSAEGRVQAWNSIAPAIERLSDRIERAAVAKDMASYIGVDEALVLERFRRDTKTGKPVAARPVVASHERLLIGALLASEQARLTVLPQLEGMTELDRMTTRNILRTLSTLCAEGNGMRFADLEARLGEKDRDLLSSLLFADEEFGEEMALNVAQACLQRLKEQTPKSQVTELRTRIRAAERNGNLIEALRLTEELERCLRQ